MNGQTIRADMYVNDVLVGRSSANLDTSDTTTILDLETTNTLDLNYELKAGDEVCWYNFSITTFSYRSMLWSTMLVK